MALPKTVKYLLCYLPFILIGTGLIVFGVFQKDSARIASLIVGVVVLFSGLFAWCTDSEVGCFVVCTWSHRERSKTKNISKPTIPADQAAEIFTIHNNRTVVDSPRTNTLKSKKKLSQAETHSEKSEGFHEEKMLQRDQHNQPRKYSMHSMNRRKISVDEEAAYHRDGGGGGRRRPRLPTNVSAIDNFPNNWKPNGIHGRDKLRLTVNNLKNFNKQYQYSLDLERMRGDGMHDSVNMINNQTFELAINISIQKSIAIKNWIKDVPVQTQENVGLLLESPPSSMPSSMDIPWGVNKAYDMEMKKKEFQLSAHDQFSSFASESGIEPHSLPKSFGSDCNKSLNGTIGSPELPEVSFAQEFYPNPENEAIADQPPERLSEQPLKSMEAVIPDQYV